MCRTLVTYRSRTGATSYYAWVIASELGADRREWEEGMDLTGYDLVIYGGGVYAGNINGLAEARREVKKQKVGNFVVFATGGTPQDVKTTIDLVWERNLKGIDYSFPHFYMQSGLCYGKLPMKDRLKVRIAASIMKSQIYDVSGIPFFIRKSYSIADPEYADGLISYCRKWYA